MLSALSMSALWALSSRKMFPDLLSPYKIKSCLHSSVCRHMLNVLHAHAKWKQGKINFRIQRSVSDQSRSLWATANQNYLINGSKLIKYEPKVILDHRNDGHSTIILCNSEEFGSVGMNQYTSNGNHRSSPKSYCSSLRMKPTHQLDLKTVDLAKCSHTFGSCKMLHILSQMVSKTLLYIWLR